MKFNRKTLLATLVTLCLVYLGLELTSNNSTRSLTIETATARPSRPLDTLTLDGSKDLEELPS